MTNFQKLYDENQHYIERRDAESIASKRVTIEVGSYKIPSLTSVLPKGICVNSVAEIGCGTGEIVSNFCPKSQIRRVGFDISPLNIQAAEKRFPQTEFTTDPFEHCTEKFDVMILSDILEHVPDATEFLRSAATLGSVVLVNLPLEKCWTNRNRKYGVDDPSGHLRAYSLTEGFELFRSANLKVIDHLQLWPLEEPQEALRQKLNVEHTGNRFSGSAMTQPAKIFGFFLLRNIKPVGRRVFPSNLFASLIGAD